MDRKKDEQALEALMESMSKMKNFRDEQLRKKEGKFWADINVPCRLDENINQLTKNEMDNIRKHLNLKKLSSLKKQELADELIKQIPEQSEKVFMLFDKERYRLAKRISDNGGYTYENSFPLQKVEYLREQGIIFSGSIDGKKILTMPLELLKIFRKIDTTEYKKIVGRNTNWILLSQGLLYYYGVLNFKKLENMLTKLTGQKTDNILLFEVLYDAMGYYEQIKPTTTEIGFCYERVFDEEMIIKQQKARSDIDYCPFTKDQLIKAGEPEYIDQTPAFNHFLNFLLKHYEMTREEIIEIARQCIDIIQNDEKPSTIVEYLNTQLEFPSFEMVQQLTGEIMNLSNNTRMWILKGHTPKEISKREKKHLQSPPNVPFATKKNSGKVINIKTKTKIGRNTLCPCGSGKKYKRCCGK